MLDEYLNTLTKEAQAKDVEHGHLSTLSVDELAKLAGIKLAEDVCPKCSSKMKKEGSIYKCAGCGKMKHASAVEKEARVTGASMPIGLEEAAVPYEHRKARYQGYLEDKSGEEPTSYGRAMGTGGLIGGAIGGIGGLAHGISGGKREALVSGLAGGLTGAGVGAGMGALSAKGDKMEIERAKRILGEGRVDEDMANRIGTVRSHERYAKQREADRRHRELLDAVKNKQASEEKEAGIAALKTIGKGLMGAGKAAVKGSKGGGGLAGAKAAVGAGTKGGRYLNVAKNTASRLPGAGAAGKAVDFAKKNPLATAAGASAAGGFLAGRAGKETTASAEATSAGKILARMDTHTADKDGGYLPKKDMKMETGTHLDSKETEKEAQVLMKVGQAVGQMMAKQAYGENLRIPVEELRESLDEAKAREDIKGRGKRWQIGGGVGGGIGGGALGALPGLLLKRPGVAAAGGLAGAAGGGYAGQAAGKAHGEEEAAADKALSMLRNLQAHRKGQATGYSAGLSRGYQYGRGYGGDK